MHELDYAEKGHNTGDFFHEAGTRELFPDGNLGLKEIPPLLNPDLSAAEAREANKLWCQIFWKPECPNTKLDLSVEKEEAKVPERFVSVNAFYRSLARDVPIQMEFIPTAEIMRKLVDRATQIKKTKIKETLNPYNDKVF
jgi:hypothetical protein